MKNANNLEAIKKATEALSQFAQKIGEKLYKAAQEQQQNNGTQNASSDDKKDDEVKESEAEEK